MAINNIVPRVDSEGKLGIQNKKWNEVNAVNINASTLTSQKVRASDLLTVNDQDLITAGNNIGISKNAQGQYEISSNALSSIPSASTIQAGVIEIATDAEATLGALNSVAVTPKQLKDNLKKSSGTNSEIQISDNLGGFSSSSLYQDSNGNILPQSDNVTSIGSQSQKVKQIFLSSNSSQGFDGTYDSLVNKPNFAGGINYKSTYDASTNTPDLTLIDNEVGDLYKVSVAGSIGSISLLAGDHIIFNSNITTSTLSDLESYIDKIDNTESVTSVNNKVGAVDIGFFDLSDTTGATPSDGNYVVAVTGSTLSLANYNSNSLVNWQEDSNGDLLPVISSTYSIGNTNFRVKDLYLTNNSINFENGMLSVSGGTISFANNALAKYSDIKHNFSELDDINITGQYGLLTYDNGSIDLSINDSYSLDTQVYNGSTTYHVISAPTSKSYIKMTKQGGELSSSDTSARRVLFPDPNDSFAGTIIKLKASSTTGNGWIRMSANNLVSYVDSVSAINAPSAGVYRSKYVNVEVGTEHTYLCTSTDWILVDVERNITGNNFKLLDGKLDLVSGSLYLNNTKLLTSSDSITNTSFYTTTITSSQTVQQITDVRRQHYNITTGGITITIPAASGAAGGIFSVRNNSSSSVNLAFTGITYELANGTQGTTSSIEIKPNITRTFVWVSDTEVNETDVTSIAHMSDVSLNSLAANEILKYDGTNWINVPAPSGGTYLPGLSDDQAHTITLRTGLDSTSGSIATPYNLVPQVTNSGSLGSINNRFAEVTSNKINVTGLNTLTTPGQYTFETTGNIESILNITSNRGAVNLKLNTNGGNITLSTETAFTGSANVKIDLPYNLSSEIANLTLPVNASTSPMSYKFEAVDQQTYDGQSFYRVKSAFMLDENIESFTDTSKNETTPTISAVSCKTYIFISRIADTLKTVNLGSPERVGQKFIIKNLSTSTNNILLQPTAGITFDDGQIASIIVQNNDAITLIADSNTNWILV